MSRRRGAYLVFVLASLSGVRPVAADEDSTPPDVPYVFVAEPGFGMESGVLSVSSLSRVVGLYDAQLSQALRFEENGAARAGLGIAGRLTKTLLVDLPLVDMETVFIHEVFGHGARGREAGKSPTYVFRLPGPYGKWLDGDKENPHEAYTYQAETGRPERDLPMALGGIEADYFTAYWGNLRLMQRDGFMHYRDMMEYGMSKLNYFGRLRADLSTYPEDTIQAGDPDNYITELQERFNRWRPEGRAAIARSLRRAYVFNFIDPTFWLCAYHGLVTYLIRGERAAEMPRLKLGDVFLFPGTRFNLTPFGAEHYVDLFAGTKDMVGDVYGRAGSSGLATYWGLGGRVMGFEPGGGVTLGGELDLWYQPEILFHERYVFDRPNLVGVNAGVHLGWRIIGPVGVVGKVAYKTKGYVMGQPVAQGFHGYAGISLATDLEPGFIDRLQSPVQGG